jgi:hypothetical protein
MVLKEATGEFVWKNEGEDERGYYFVLTDSNRGFDYSVVLIKDSGDVQVNGAYLKTHPRDIQEFVQKKLQSCQGYKPEAEPTEEPKKKSKPKAEPKKETKSKAELKKDIKSMVKPKAKEKKE